MTLVQIPKIGEILKKEDSKFKSTVRHRFKSLENVNELKDYLDWADLEITLKIKTNYETPGCEADYNCGRILINEMHEERVTEFLDLVREFLNNNSKDTEPTSIYISNE